MKGWVYVMSNKAMPGLVKVGFTLEDPDLRAAELNHTGSPHPYSVEYEALMEHPRAAEQNAHKRLSDCREGKEWFRCSPEHALAAIKAVAGEAIITETFKRADRARAEKMRAAEEKREKEKAAKETARLEARRKVIARYEMSLKELIPTTSFWIYFIYLLIPIALGLACPSRE